MHVMHGFLIRRTWKSLTHPLNKQPVQIVQDDESLCFGSTDQFDCFICMHHYLETCRGACATFADTSFCKVGAHGIPERQEIRVRKLKFTKNTMLMLLNTLQECHVHQVRIAQIQMHRATQRFKFLLEDLKIPLVHLLGHGFGHKHNFIDYFKTGTTSHDE